MGLLSTDLLQLAAFLAVYKWLILAILTFLVILILSPMLIQISILILTLIPSLIRMTTQLLAESRYTHYTRKNAQLVTNLQLTCIKLVGTSLLQDLFALLLPSLLTNDKLIQACSRLATSLMNSTALLQVVPTTCYRAASQQLVKML